MEKPLGVPRTSLERWALTLVLVSGVTFFFGWTLMDESLLLGVMLLAVAAVSFPAGMLLSIVSLIRRLF